MSAPQPVSITLSLDLELEIGRAASTHAQRLDDLTPELVALLDRHGIAATWGLADPARSAATEAILTSRLPHEIAVLGDRSWLGWGAGGSRANRELARRITGAAARQIAIHSLVLHNESSIANGLPLAEMGITTIRQPIGHQVLRPVSLAGVSRGLKVAEQVQRLVLPTWWNWFTAGNSRFDPESELAAHFGRRSLLSDRTVYHFGLDAQQLCSAGPRALKRLDSLLSELGELRDQRGVRLQTLRSWTERQTTRERRAA